MNIFIDENIPLLAETLRGCGEITKFSGRQLSDAELRNGHADVLIVRSTTKVNMELLEGCNLKLVGTATSGTEHIDKKFLSENNIAFADAPGSNANSVAEMVVNAALKWAEANDISLSGKTIGVIGYGNVGKIVARYAEYFGMKVLLNDPPLADLGFVFPETMQYSSLEKIFAESDIVTNHVPMVKSSKYPTLKLIGRQLIDMLKPGSLIVHASRGGVIDEGPLLEALRANRIEAAIDVWENEPLINPELCGLTIMSTPHVGGYSRDGKLRGTMRMAQAFEQVTGIAPDYSALAELATYKPMPPKDFKNEKQLLQLLRASRDFARDTALLRDSMKLASDRDRALAFDILRKDYPQRREIL